MLLKWGIASAGNISSDFTTALRNLPKDEHQVIAVAAKDKARASSFAAKHNIPIAYDSYDQLAQNHDIDVVYIGALNPQHFQICKLMLKNGKHVLCEKPLCMNYKQTEELIKIADQNKLFLMEAMWTRFLPVYNQLRKAIEDSTIGEIFHVTANFGVHITADRVSKRDMGGSAVLDIGVYTLQLALLVFGTNTPYEISSTGHLNEEGIDESYTCVIKYPNGKTATLIHNSRINMENDINIYGTDGFIKIHDPHWCPTKITIKGKTTEFPLPEKDTGEYNYINSAGLYHEANEVRRCIKEGLLESPLMTHADSLKLSKLEDTIRQQLGVKFDVD